MKKLPKFESEQLLAERLKSSEALFEYEKLFIGTQIKKLRQKAGLKQAALGKLLGTSQSVIARMEAGRQNFTLKTLTAVSYLLGKRLHIRFQ